MNYKYSSGFRKTQKRIVWLRNSFLLKIQAQGYICMYKHMLYLIIQNTILLPKHESFNLVHFMCIMHNPTLQCILRILSYEFLDRKIFWIPSKRLIFSDMTFLYNLILVVSWKRKDYLMIGKNVKHAGGQVNEMYF